jgi:hypothetical protein
MSQRIEQSKQSLAPVTHWLIRHAARRAPDSLSSRLEEEWFADLHARTSELSGLRFALGCVWASLVIVNEYPRSRVAATSAAARGLITLADRNFGYFSLRSGTLFLIAGLHAALFYGLLSLAQRHKVDIEPPLQNFPVHQPQPPISQPPVSSPVLKNPNYDRWIDKLPMPLVQDPVTDFPENVDPVPAEPLVEPAPPSHEVRRVQGGPGLDSPILTSSIR